MIDNNLDALPAGLVLDGYRIERELGSGGFGITYLATEIESGRQVAIKEYMPKSFARRGAKDHSVRPVDSEARTHFEWGLQRFRDEARSLIRLDHPNIVQTLRLFASNGTAYIVMNYVDGESLGAALKRAGRLSPAEIDNLVPSLLDGLAAVHAAGYLHRDLKPANIYIRRSDNQPILLDFGAAREALGRETQTLSAIVTPGFSPPEQYGRGAKQRETTDIYALGATLYRCIAGETPPEAPDRVSAMVANEPDPLVPAAEAGGGAYAPALLDAVDAALRIREIERPQTVAAFREAICGRNPARPFGNVETPPVQDETLFAGSRLASAVRANARPSTRRAFRGTLIPLVVVAITIAAGGAYFAYADWRMMRDRAEAQREEAAVALAKRRAADDARRRDEEEKARIRAEDERKAGEVGRKAEEEARRKSESDAAKAEEERRRRVAALGPSFRDCPGCPMMVVLPSARFVMGSPATEEGRYNYEGPQRTVTIGRSFAIAKYKVTRAEWSMFVRESRHRSAEGCMHFTGKQWLRDVSRNWENPGFSQTDDHPAVCINWQDAKAFATWLSRRSGKVYRLPSEAEWEYAARAGTVSARPWDEAHITRGHGSTPSSCTAANGADLSTRRAGLDFPKVAECDDGYPYTSPVIRFAPNRFDLYDMIGNAWEWTEDCWLQDYGLAPTDAKPATEGANCGLRAVRGGGWTNPPSDLRSAVRVFANPRLGYNYVGLRIARDVE